MALMGRKVSVEKVMKMVDDRVRLLGDEQRLHSVCDGLRAI